VPKETTRAKELASSTERTSMRRTTELAPNFSSWISRRRAKERPGKAMKEGPEESRSLLRAMALGGRRSSGGGVPHFLRVSLAVQNGCPVKFLQKLYICCTRRRKEFEGNHWSCTWRIKITPCCFCLKEENDDECVCSRILVEASSIHAWPLTKASIIVLICVQQLAAQIVKVLSNLL
jgi:hypothetical protein